MFLAIADAGGPKEQIWLEESAGAVVQALVRAQEPVPEYYNILTAAGPSNITFEPVVLSSGIRAAAPAREVAEIEAGGEVVGSAIVER